MGAAIEAGCVAYDIRKAKKAKSEGRLTDRDYEDVVGKRVAVAVGDVSLSTVGKYTIKLFKGPFKPSDSESEIYFDVRDLFFLDYSLLIFASTFGWCEQALRLNEAKVKTTLLQDEFLGNLISCSLRSARSKKNFTFAQFK